MSEKKRVSAELTMIGKGPLKVKGNFTILNPSGVSFELPTPNEVFLCTCGHSKEKPFCDGSHNKTFVE